MRIGEADIESVFVDGVFGVELAGVLTEVTTINAFVGKNKMAIAVGEVEVVLFEELTSSWLPIVITADKSFAFFVNSKNGAAVGMLLDTTFLVINERGEIFIEKQIRVEADNFGGGGDFQNELGVEFLVDSKLAAKSGGIVAGVEIVMGSAEILAMDSPEILMRTREFNHKYIIHEDWARGQKMPFRRRAGEETDYSDFLDSGFFSDLGSDLDSDLVSGLASDLAGFSAGASDGAAELAVGAAGAAAGVG